LAIILDGANYTDRYQQFPEAGITGRDTFRTGKNTSVANPRGFALLQIWSHVRGVMLRNYSTQEGEL
jgi:hypothetical protein